MIRRTSLVEMLADRIARGLPLPPISGGGTDDPPPTPTPTPTPSPTPTPTPTPAPEAAEGWRKLLEKHNNDASAVALKLYDENHDLRTKNRELRAKVPGEGAVILDAEQAKAWQAYSQLGTAEDLRTALSEHGTLKAEIAKRDKATLHQQIADAYDFKASVLSDLLDKHNPTLEAKDVTGPGGKVQKRYTVKDGDRTVDLADWLKAKEPEYADALPRRTPTAPLGTPPRRDAGSSPNDRTATTPRRVVNVLS